MSFQEKEAAAERLAFLIDRAARLIMQIPAAELVKKPAPGKWSMQEILGHLVDSAANNHQRFIRIQYEDEPVIYYDQEQWNKLSHYNTLESSHIISLWSLYNRHLVEIIKRVPEASLQRCGVLKNGRKATLLWHITDYVSHLEQLAPGAL